MSKSYWLYGAAMGVLLLALQVVHYKTMIRDVQLEFFGLLIALIFMGLGIWLGISLYQRAHKRALARNTHFNHSGLSDRELDVLELLAEGLSNQEIADRLFVSLNTAKTHLSNIYQKLGVKRRTQAVQKAREMRLLSSPERSKS